MREHEYERMWRLRHWSVSSSTTNVTLVGVVDLGIPRTEIYPMAEGETAKVFCFYFYCIRSELFELATSRRRYGITICRNVSSELCIYMVCKYTSVYGGVFKL